MWNCEGYTPRESMQLENGEYRFRIRGVSQERYNSGGYYLKITCDVSGHPGAVPNVLTYNERPRLGTYKANGNPVEQKDLDRWDRDMTVFFDSFGINRGDFETAHWIGKIGNGRVNWQYDPHEPDKKSKKYKEITLFVKKDAAPAGQTPQPVQPAPVAPPPAENIPF